MSKQKCTMVRRAMIADTFKIIEAMLIVTTNASL